MEKVAETAPLCTAQGGPYQGRPQNIHLLRCLHVRRAGLLRGWLGLWWCLPSAPPAALAGRHLWKCGSFLSRGKWLLPKCAARGLQLILWDHILHKQATGVRDDAYFPTLPLPPHHER